MGIRKIYYSECDICGTRVPAVKLENTDPGDRYHVYGKPEGWANGASPSVFICPDCQEQKGFMRSKPKYSAVCKNYRDGRCTTGGGRRFTQCNGSMSLCEVNTRLKK